MNDVVVVGGGIMGLMAARELRVRGREVMLLERDQPGRQASWASAGIIGKTHRNLIDPVQSLIRDGAFRFERLAEELREETAVDIQYVERGDLIPAVTDDEAMHLKIETVRMASEGQTVEFVEGPQVNKAEPAVSRRIIAARLQVGGQVENRRLCQALETSCRRLGVKIEVGSTVSEVLSASGRITGVRTLERDIAADSVVLAAGSWSGQIRGADPVVPVVPQRGQILALGLRDVPLWRNVRPLGDPYIVPRPDGRVIVGATREDAGYEASLTARGMAWLLRSAIDLVPGLADSPVLETWTGFRPKSPDDHPAIGRGNLEGLFYCTGHGPSGIAPAPASIDLLMSWMFGTPPPIDPKPFDPRRFAAAAH
ncbi:MAG: glycine oxidase ThiO [Chloroflexota bacterium]